MRKVFLVFIFLILFPVFTPHHTFAQSPTENTRNPLPKEHVYRAKVVNIIEEGTSQVGEYANPFQIVQIELLEGPQKGEKQILKHGDLFTLREDMKVKTGEKVVVVAYERPSGDMDFIIYEKYRIDTILYITAIFVLLVFGLIRWKGLGALIGLAFSLFVIIKFIVPNILSGKDPLLISIIGASIIMLVTIYLAHGLSRKTTIALISTIISFITVGILSILFVNLARLTGLGSEDAYALQFGLANDINSKGLLLGGILIGTLGVLDDITTSMSASVFEIARHNPKSDYITLVKSGFRIGQEHIASLVNTLVLAYAGTSMPLFIFILVNPSDRPLWSILNSELLAEEIIRTLSGSFGILLAVPITAVLASWIAYHPKK